MRNTKLPGGATGENTRSSALSSQPGATSSGRGGPIDLSPQSASSRISGRSDVPYGVSS